MATVYERALAWRKKKEEEERQSAQSEIRNRALAWKIKKEGIDLEDVGQQITNRVNTWLNNNESYINDYNARFQNRAWDYTDSYVGDSRDYLSTASQQARSFAVEANDIKNLLSQYGSFFDQDWVSGITKALDDGMAQQGQIRQAAAQDVSYWSKFTPNEEQTAAGYTTEKMYKEWQAERQQYAEDKVLDLDAAAEELETLKKEKEKREQHIEYLNYDLSAGLEGLEALKNEKKAFEAEQYDQRIAKLEEQIERAKYVQGYEGYMENMDAKDYAAGSQFDSTRTNTSMEEAEYTYHNEKGTSYYLYDEKKLFGDFLYDYINGQEEARKAGDVYEAAHGERYRFYKTMSEEEVGVFNYLYKTKGEEAANQYLSYIQSDLKGRERAQEQAKWAALAKEDPFGTSVFSVIMSPTKGLSYLGQAVDMLNTGKIDQYSDYNRHSRINTAIRSQVSSMIEKSGKWGKVGSFAYNTGMSMADFLFTTAVSGGNQGLSLAIMGTGAAADATLAAKDRGLSDKQAFTLGTIAGVAEVAMEKISLGAWLDGDMSKGALRYVLNNAFSESIEETGTSVVNLLADVMIAGDKSEWNVAMQEYMDSGKTKKEAFGLVAAEQAAKIGLDALGGFFSGGVIGGGTSVTTKTQSSSTRKNQVPAQLTQNEQTVVDRVVKARVAEEEKTGKKLSKAEKAEIYDQVIEDMDKGQLATGEIEAALGGETYRKYQESVSREEALQKEYDQLGDLVESQMTAKQKRRFQELEQLLEAEKKNTSRTELQAQLGREVSEMVKADRLAESYNERGRKSQAFQADLSRYDAKQRATVQAAMDSGILNNTNRTHEFVDLVAKVAADHGLKVNFADNKKLKESGFALDGVTVNGFVNQDGITINVNSAKALNSVVGHEIVHVLESDTKLYDGLKTTLEAYAKTKGEYDSRLEQLTKLYEGKGGYTGDDAAAKIERELVADMVGDYLFTDKAFVQQLSTEHRNVFQKIYDQIKYLCKVATAGSKEARQLEKVKKIFQNVYREGAKNPTGEGGLKYDLSDGTSKDASELSRSDLQYLLESAQNGELSDGSYIPLRRNTPEFFIGVVKEHSKGSVVIEDHPMAATVEHLRQNMDEEDGQSYGRSRPHGFSVDDLITISEKMGDPSYIVLQKNGRYAEVVSFYNGSNKQVVVSIDLADSSSSKPKNYKYSQYMNGYGDDYYNIIVTQYEPDSLEKYLRNNEVVYSKKEMNGRYQVGSGRIVTVTHDTPFIENIVPPKQSDVNNKNSLSAQGQVESGGKGWQVRGRDVALEDGPGFPLPPGYQEGASVAGSTQKTVTPAQENREISFPMPEDAARVEEQEDGLFPLPEDIALQEQRQLDEAYRQRMGEDPTLYDTDEDEGVETTRDKLEVKQKNLQWQLQENRRLKESTMQIFDKQIEELQAKYDGKKHKESKNSQALLRRIQRLKRQKSDRAAEYDQTISQIQNRMGKIDEKLQTGTPEKVDRLEKIFKKIDAKMEDDEGVLAKEYYEERDSLQKEVGSKDRDTWVGDKARDLFLEMSSWVKGAEPSQELHQLIRTRYDWKELRNALEDIKDGYTLLRSPAELSVREVLERTYADKVQRLENLDAEYQQKVEQLHKDAQEQKKKSTTAYKRKEANAKYMLEVAKIAGDISTWVDKKLGLYYKTNTLRRNLRDIVRDAEGKPDIARADAIYDYLQGSYNRNEARLKKDLNALFDKYRKMDINAAENAYIQMLGEYLQGSNDGVKTYVTEDMLAEYRKEHGEEIDEEKCRKIVDMARQDYDMFFERVNEVLREHGMEELKYVQGYFPHLKKIKQNWIQKALNIVPVEKKNKPTQTAGRSGMFKPSKKSLRYSKERQGTETDFNFLKGYEQYAAGMLDWIYHIPDIQRRRALENYIRITHAEKDTTLANKIKAIRNSDVYNADEEQIALEHAFQKLDNPLGNFVTDLMIGTNVLAGKKTGGDRTVEEFLNPDSASVVNRMSSRVSANLVAGSISAGMSNLIPIQQSWAQVSPISSVKSFGAAFRNSFMEQDDGVVEKSVFLTNRLRNPDKLYKEKWDNIGEVVSWWGSMMDSFSSQTVWRSKYMENIEAGMTETEAVKNADQFAENVLAGRSRGNMPTLFESKNIIAKAFTTCQLEVANEYGYWLKDLPQDMQNEARGKLVAGYMKTFIGATMLNELLFKPITGRAAATDPIGMIAQLLLGLLDEDEEPEDAILDFAENVLQEIPLVGGLLGGGRVPISSAMPYDGVWGAAEGVTRDVASGDWKSIAEELSNPLFYLVPPMGGGQLRKTAQGLGMYLFNEEPGSYTADGRLRYPVTDNVFSVGQKALFGKWAGKNAQQYIEEGRSPLSAKQTQEFKDTGMSIQQYWAYQDGLKELNGQSESGKASINAIGDYIGGLDLTVAQKNILINNIAGRKDPIDMTTYSDYPNFEEFDFGTKNPGQYALSKAVGGFDSYKTYREALGKFESDKDENGETVAGSKKQKVVRYISNLDVERGIKLLLLKNEYPGDDTYNYEIVEYLNDREDISRKEMETILGELGFRVYPNGTVTWD